MDYAEIARQSRIKCLELVYKAQSSHIGSLFSCADIMAVLFEKINLDKDKFVLSAGWKVCMLYYHLWRKGRITEEELNSYCQEGSKFIGLAEPFVVPEIQVAGGSMGIGFSMAVGMAWAKKIRGEEGTVYVLMSDGELQIGTVYESALKAAHHKLDNLVVIVDRNSYQAMGFTEEVLALEPLARKWEAFGWEWNIVMNGHNHDYLSRAFSNHLRGPAIHICQTTKGRGWKRAENNNLYHYKAPSKEEYQEALAELNG